MTAQEGDRTMKLSLIAFAAVLAMSGLAESRADQAAPTVQVDDEGLAPIDIKGLDHVYARPGANLSRYDKVMLDPVEVSFSKNWKPDRAGGPITAAEKQTIKVRLAQIFRQELKKELQGPGGYGVVDATDEDVLRIRAEIRDLYINAPDVPRSGPSRVYAVSVGEMRLVAELRDGPTGALIARVVDFKKDPDAPWLHLTTRVDNEAAARRAVADWARILRRQLDAAHGLKESALIPHSRRRAA
jgi:Protein of unknown function (DUF3313)